MSSHTIVPLFLAGCALLIALALGVLVWRVQRLKREVEIARGWPQAAGRVVATRLEVRHFSKGFSCGAIVAERAAGTTGRAGFQCIVDAPGGCENSLAARPLISSSSSGVTL